MLCQTRLSVILIAACIGIGSTGCKRRDAVAAVDARPVAAAPVPAAEVKTATTDLAPAPKTEEAPAAVKPAPAFDISSVPMSEVPLPAFPYIMVPKEVDENASQVTELMFDRKYVLAGASLLPVEGHFLRRYFSIDKLKMSPLEAFRNYSNYMKSLGGVKVNSMHPLNDSLVKQTKGGAEAVVKNLGQLGVDAENPDDAPSFVQYLIRKPTGNIWISYALYGAFVSLAVIEEKPMQQRVMNEKADGVAVKP
jgi:OOP family OmpA-OmpF porin